MTSPNEGAADRTIRLIVGVALLYAGWRLWPGLPAAGSLVVGAVAVATGALGWCPAYTLFGWSTCRRRT